MVGPARERAGGALCFIAPLRAAAELRRRTELLGQGPPSTPLSSGALPSRPLRWRGLLRRAPLCLDARLARRWRSGLSAVASSHRFQYSSAAPRASNQLVRWPAPLRQPLGRLSAVMVQSHRSASSSSRITVATATSPLNPCQFPSGCCSQRIIVLSPGRGESITREKEFAAGFD